jgi:transketolase
MSANDYKWEYVMQAGGVLTPKIAYEANPNLSQVENLIEAHNAALNALQKEHEREIADAERKITAFLKWKCHSDINAIQAKHKAELREAFEAGFNALQDCNKTNLETCPDLDCNACSWQRWLEGRHSGQREKNP